jgi:hypothetical protein
MFPICGFALSALLVFLDTRIMTLTRITLALLLSLTATGCATLDKSECREADWGIIGLEDGARGRPLSYIGRHREACAEHGVKLDLALYQRGHTEGLKQFCTADNGFRQGRAGRTYNNACPAELNGQFLAGYETGRQLHALSTDIDRMQNDVRDMRSALDETLERQQNVENLMVSGTISANTRKSLLDQFKVMQTNVAALEISIRETETEATRLQGQYDLLNASHPYQTQ